MIVDKLILTIFNWQAYDGFDLFPNLDNDFISYIA